jgi:hypothetical protein
MLLAARIPTLKAMFGRGGPAWHMAWCSWMKAVISPAATTLKSPAAAWDMDRKLDMLREFILLIRKHTEVGFGCALDAKHYREVVKAIDTVGAEEGLKTKPFNTQMFCMARIVRLVMQYLEESVPEQERQTSLVFDDDEHYSKSCYALLSNLKKRVPAIKNSIVNISFADGRMVLPAAGRGLTLICILQRIEEKGERLEGNERLQRPAERRGPSLRETLL